MTKTLNQIIFFSSTNIRIFFSVTLGFRILKKNPFGIFKLFFHLNRTDCCSVIFCFLCVVLWITCFFSFGLLDLCHCSVCKFTASDFANKDRVTRTSLKTPLKTLLKITINTNTVHLLLIEYRLYIECHKIPVESRAASNRWKIPL
jgi:hypothetical protein